MSKTVTIPTGGGNPFVVILGGVKYVYKPGETVEVPDGVALEIEEWERWHKKYFAPTQPPFDDDDDEGGGSGGLTKAQINALDGLFKIATYKTNPTTAYAAFKSAFGLNGSGGGDTGGDTPVVPDVPDTFGYNVTNNLTGVTNSNAQTKVTEGFYSAMLTANEGYSLESVVITMGGKDITDTVYGGGNILITEVTGDIVITAVAELIGLYPVYELAEATTFDGTSVIDTGVTLALTNESWSICVDWTGNKGYNTVFATHGEVPAQSVRVHSDSDYYWQASLCSGNVNAYTKGNGGGKYVITHYKGETNATVYYISNGAVTSETPASAQYWNTANSKPSTLKLGGAFDGTPKFTGTINRFAIYGRMLTAEEISEFMGVA